MSRCACKFFLQGKTSLPGRWTPWTSLAGATPPSLTPSRLQWVKSLSCVRLFATPWTIAYQAPLSMGFSRQERWSGLLFPSPGESSRPRDRTWVSRVSGRRFTIWATREAPRGLGVFINELRDSKWQARLEFWRLDSKWTENSQLFLDHAFLLNRVIHLTHTSAWLSTHPI